MQASRKSLESALAGQGLRLRGGFIPTPDDGIAPVPGGPAAVVWMVGQVGSACWPVFSGSRFFGDGLPDPMDRWSKSIGDELARACGGAAIYPSDGPPYAPFQRWAARAEPLRASPLMLQMHPRHGLWHAWRFALVAPLLADADRAALGRPHGDAATDLCLSCDGRPCLSACPVDAFRDGGYAVAVCAAHLHDAAGATCMQSGCLARRACPVAPQLRYDAQHAAFHMAAFASKR